MRWKNQSGNSCTLQKKFLKKSPKTRQPEIEIEQQN